MHRLRHILSSSKISTERADLLSYGFDASKIKSQPAAVCWPEDTEDVIALSKFAYEEDIPLVPRGAGTSTTGSAVPTRGGIVVSLERMNQIIEIDTDNLFVMVEPGLINGHLQRELSLRGYFYPPDPSSLEFCTIGGNVAVNAGGPRAVKYGVTSNYVRYLEAVLMDGRLIKVGARTKKSVVGYDLKSLLIGSEGTLATITKIGLGILPEPESILTLIASFDSLRGATETVTAIIRNRIIPRALEFIDRTTLWALKQYQATGFMDGEALLIIELDGQRKAVEEDADRVVKLCQQ
ncbi:MAG: FAD-binding protein, partial [Nitrospirae bacterium]